MYQGHCSKYLPVSLLYFTQWTLCEEAHSTEIKMMLLIQEQVFLMTNESNFKKSKGKSQLILSGGGLNQNVTKCVI